MYTEYTPLLKTLSSHKHKVVSKHSDHGFMLVFRGKVAIRKRQDNPNFENFN